MKARRALYATLAVVGLVLALGVPAFAVTPPGGSKQLTLHEKLDLVLKKLEDLVGACAKPVDPVKPVEPVKPPVSAACAGIDYAKWAGKKPQDIGLSFEMSSGLPAGWSWECAYAAGVIRVIEGGGGSGTGVVTPVGQIPWNKSAGEGVPGLTSAGEPLETVEMVIVVPDGFKGTRRIEASQRSTPGGSSQYDEIGFTILGQDMGMQANSFAGITPVLTGPSTVVVRVRMRPAGRAAVQLMGGT